MNLRTLGAFVRKRAWVVVLVVVLVEVLMAGMTALVSEQYQARSLVRLGKVEGVDVGAQGAVVEQVQTELANQAQVSVTPRPNGMVLINAEASTPDETVKLVKDVATRLVSRSRELVDMQLRDRRKVVEDLKTSIGYVDSQMEFALAMGEREKAGPVHVLIEYMTVTQLKEMLDLRTGLRRQLVRAEGDLISGVTQPAIVWEAETPTTPFRPRWRRNLIMGAIFGVGFGVFVVMLMGILHEIERNQHARIEVR